ncbi:hypothetical protein C8R45DRAFT_937101 [Mycena sanguinolenta]|nr:hypothetical protein C8R45DRAFT_937101 [Mycena sanguinolenta]
MCVAIAVCVSLFHSHYLQCFCKPEGSAITTRSTLENATIKELKAFRRYRIPRNGSAPAFQAYMAAHAEPPKTRADSSPISSHAPSQASLSVSMARSRSSSRISLVPSSRASSPAFYAPSDSVSLAEFSRSGSPVSNFESDQPSRPSSSMSVIEIKSDSDDGDTKLLGNLVPPRNRTSPSPLFNPKLKKQYHFCPLANKRKGTTMSQIAITRQLKVDEIIHLITVPPTFDVPRKPTAILLDLSGGPDLGELSQWRHQIQVAHRRWWNDEGIRERKGGGGAQKTKAVASHEACLRTFP